MPETQEIISFDAAGVCGACRNMELKEAVDWAGKEREFAALLERYRGKYPYDCVIPFSGGKDSTYTAYTLVRTYGLKPLIVSFDHHLLRPRVIQNRERTLRQLGVDYLGFSADWQLVKRMMRISLERKGDILWYQHCGIFAYPMQIAVKFGVPMMIWGERSSEYTSYYGFEEEEEVDERRFNMFINLGITAEDMLGMLNEHPLFRGLPAVTARDMGPYTYPKRADLKTLQCRSICLGSYVPWDVKAHTEVIKRELAWEGDDVEGVPPEYSYEKVEDMLQGVQDYLKFIKRGYGRMTHLASIDIRNGRLTREKALAMIEEWEGLRPASLDIFLQWLGMSEEEFYAVATRHAVSPWRHDPATTKRGPELWDQPLWPTI